MALNACVCDERRDVGKCLSKIIFQACVREGSRVERKRLETVFDNAGREKE